jgi:hypothetical protein
MTLIYSKYKSAIDSSTQTLWGIVINSIFDKADQQYRYYCAERQKYLPCFSLNIKPRENKFLIRIEDLSKLCASVNPPKAAATVRWNGGGGSSLQLQRLQPRKEELMRRKAQKTLAKNLHWSVLQVHTGTHHQTCPSPQQSVATSSRNRTQWGGWGPSQQYTNITHKNKISQYRPLVLTVLLWMTNPESLLSYSRLRQSSKALRKKKKKG